LIFQEIDFVEVSTPKLCMYLVSRIRDTCK